MALDIFEHRFSDETLPVLSEDNRGLYGKALLDCIQTVVNVLADEDNNGYAVQFSPTMAAYTEHDKKRITLSGMPLFGAAPGTPMADIAAIMTGFAIHEVGHTKRVGIIDATLAEWPGKVLPKTIANIIEDVVLELRVIERYAGFRDVFAPTLEWVAEATCPKEVLEWGGSSGHKVNLVGQMVRYRDYVTFGDDPVTVAELLWWDEWQSRINAALTPSEGVEMVREAIARIKSQRTETDEPVDQPPPTTTCPPIGPPPPNTGQELPDEEDDDEPNPDGEPKGDTEGEGEPTEDTEGGEDGSDGDGEDGDEPDGTEGDGDSDSDDDGDGDSWDEDDDDDDGEADDDADGEDDGSGTEAGESDESEGQTKFEGGLDERTDAERGANDGTGGGGTGQAIAEAGDDDPDAGLDETELMDSFDDLSETDNNYRDSILQDAVETERTTTRMDAGQFGTMRVVWR